MDKSSKEEGMEGMVVILQKVRGEWGCQRYATDLPALDASYNCFYDVFYGAGIHSPPFGVSFFGI